MSSTNRGKNREKADYYRTPTNAVKEFLSEWFTDLSEEDEYNAVCERPDRILWLDPCAGGDKDHKMSYADTIVEEFGARVMSIDIREDSQAEMKADYLTYKIDEKPDVIISNPPFFLAQEFIEKALEDVAKGGYVVFLLRLNFLESKARKTFFENNMPERIYVHHKRMSFSNDGKTDSVAYMHCVWKQGLQLSESKLKII